MIHRLFTLLLLFPSLIIINEFLLVDFSEDRLFQADANNAVKKGELTLKSNYSLADTLVNYCQLIEAANNYGRLSVENELTFDDVNNFNNIWKGVFNIPEYQTGITINEFIGNNRFANDNLEPFPPSDLYHTNNPDTYLLFHLAKEIGKIQNPIHSSCFQCLSESIDFVNDLIQDSDLDAQLGLQLSGTPDYPEVVSVADVDNLWTFLRCMFSNFEVNPKEQLRYDLPPIIDCTDTIRISCLSDLLPQINVQWLHCEVGGEIDTIGPNLIEGLSNCSGAVYAVQFIATDYCNQSASCFQYFILQNEGLSISCMPDRIVECESDIAAEQPNVITSCGQGANTTSSSPVLISGARDCPGAVYEITYTATDDCGRTDQCTQRFTIDNVDLIIVCPPDRAVECESDILAETPIVGTSCVLGFTMTSTNPALISGTRDCSGAIYEITYTATDDCGRTDQCTQRFTIDNVDPIIVCPPDRTVECESDILAETPIVGTSCALGFTMTSTNPTLISGTRDCPGAIYEITYAATDDCGRTDQCTQRFTIDNLGPIIDCPDRTVECEADIVLQQPRVTTSCGRGFNINSSLPSLISGSRDCPGAIYEVTHTVTDDCGSTNQCIQKFTIGNAAPIIVCSPDRTVECESDIIVQLPIIITSCTLGFNSTSTNPTLISGTRDCPGAIYEVIHTVTDNCGRTDQCTQRFTIANVGPVITCTDKTVECEADILLEIKNVTSSCGRGFSIVSTPPTLINGTRDCPGAVYEVTYTVTDICGSADQCTQRFTIDNVGPIIVCPPDRIVECESDVIAEIPVIGTSCALGFTRTSSNPTLISGTRDCPGAIYEITYTVRDDCGRTDQCTQRFTLDNAPLIIVCPPDRTVECESDVIAENPIIGTSCLLGFTTTISNPTLISGTRDCSGAIYEITYTATDDCGRTDQCTQRFTLDNAPLIIVCPPDRTVECESDVIAENPIIGTSCLLGFTTTISNPTLISGTRDCPGAIYEITYTATDDCGRTDQCTQRFTLDNAPPIIVCPPDRTVECESDVIAENPIIGTSCLLGFTTTISNPTLISGTRDCPGAIYEITYTVRDDCGRTDQCTQRFTLDNAPPIIVCPPDRTVECESDVIAENPIIGTSCALGFTTTTSNPTLISGTRDCPGAIYEITYTVRDDCGRTDQCTQRFTLDNAPLIIVCPPDRTVECESDVIAETPIVGTSCLLGFTTTSSNPTLISGTRDCSGAIYEITYTATDDCGRTDQCTQRFTLDNVPPIIVCPPDRTVECESDIIAGTPIVVTSCSYGSNTASTNPTLISGVRNCPGAVYEITYTVSDGCGRTDQCTQRFTIDNLGPIIECVDKIVECEKDILDEQPVVRTFCGREYDINSSEPRLISGTRDCPGAIYEVTHDLIDECGRTDQCRQRFYIVNDGPVINCNDQVLECEDDIFHYEPIVNTSCDLGYTINSSPPTLVSGIRDCSGAIYEVTHAVTDHCGRYTQCTQRFFIDNIGPIITCTDKIVECEEDIANEHPVVTTSCGLDYNVISSTPRLISGSRNCPGAIYEVTHTVTDHCGRVDQCIQRFTIMNAGPNVICSPDRTVECAGDIIPEPPSVLTSCGLVSDIHASVPTLISGEHDCPGAIYEIEYVVSDFCGRTSSCTQQFRIAGMPVNITCPPDMYVRSKSDISPGSGYVVDDACNLGFSVNHSNPILIFGSDDHPGAVYIVTYTVIDNCGGQASCDQYWFLAEIPDCESILPHSQAVWNAARNEYECECLPGYVLNPQGTACEPEMPDCPSMYPNSETVWNPLSQEYNCECKQGYYWNAQGTACLKIPDCESMYPFSQTIWNTGINEYECVCLTGYVWNDQRTACEPEMPDCELLYPNSQTIWNSATNEYDCECLLHFVWLDGEKYTECVPDCESLYPNSQAYLNTATWEYECDCMPGYMWLDGVQYTECVPDCNFYYPNSETVWVPANNRYECACLPGYEWNSDQTECIPEDDVPDCNSFYPNSYAVWVAANNRYECACLPGYEWNASQTACIPEDNVPDCNSVYPNSEARWDPATNQYLCYCKPGYEWNADQTACIQENEDPCSDIPNSRAVYNPSTGFYDCECLPLFIWNTQRTECVPDCKNQYPNSQTVWKPDRQQYQCDCLPGYIWNTQGTACIGDQDNPPVDPDDQHTGNCNTTYEAGNNHPKQYTIDVGAALGNVEFGYETERVKDRIQVYYGGRKIFDSQCIGTQGWRYETFHLDGVNSVFQIIINPQCESFENTVWYFRLGCPNNFKEEENELSAWIEEPDINEMFKEIGPISEDIFYGENVKDEIYFNIFPNPARKDVQIEHNTNKEVELMIIDLAGRLIKKQCLDSNMERLDISHMEEGLYIVHLYDMNSGDLLGIEKLIISR